MAASPVDGTAPGGSRSLGTQSPEVYQVAIRDVELGMHVPAENPELVPNQDGFHGNASEVADIDLPGNRVTSNSDAFEYHFTLQKPSGGQTKIRLLRNGSWLSSQQRSWQYSAATGDCDWHYWIALSELGVEGWSRLEAAQAYSGTHDLALGANGGLVTGIFEHEGSVVDLRFVNESSEEVAITSTPNHRFWSDSRQAFIACGELERGELVRGLTGGQWQLQARQSQPDARSVYNLEVSQEHVFYVGSGGILVHNMCDTGSQGGKHSGGDISGSGRTPANRLTPEAPPTNAPRVASSFTAKQLEKKWKHAVDFGITTTKRNPTTLGQFQAAITKHLDDADTVVKGTYGWVENSVVHFNPKTNLAVVLDNAGNFITGWKLKPGTPQFEKFIKDGFLK